ncbi:anaphase-promoting complex subunit 15 isoform X1 [Chrysoperla carnea]|uniref:anaphase-promoting complex subunit 15 isoform X1 n=1 Tax=Chrysoperla carnea TaxID=189513 RepID=UPI001D09700B|nr:anaphase-promoting complex subunit 15 isoform X1 [Chrysoperla carnea]
MAFPLFPSLMPKAIDSLWFNVDSPVDEDSELQELEVAHKAFRDSISQKNIDLVPIGKPASENLEEEDEDDEDDDNDDDEESDSRDEEDEDEIDMEISYEQTGPVDNTS